MADAITDVVWKSFALRPPRPVPTYYWPPLGHATPTHTHTHAAAQLASGGWRETYVGTNSGVYASSGRSPTGAGERRGNTQVSGYQRLGRGAALARAAVGMHEHQHNRV